MALLFVFQSRIKNIASNRNYILKGEFIMNTTDKVKLIVAIVIAGVIVIPPIAGAVAEKIDDVKVKRQIKKGIKEGRIILFDGHQYYEVV